MTRVLILAGFAASLRNFRGPLIQALLARNLEVHVAAPALLADTSTCTWLTERGVVVHDIPLERVGLNIIADLRTVRALTCLMRSIHPDHFIGYTIKPVIWGLIAANRTGVPIRTALITGLGFAFSSKSTSRRAFIRMIARKLYRFALRRASIVFFQNPDDREEFRRLGLLPATAKIEVVNGSGVDTEHFAVAQFPQGALCFLLIARLLGDKGIREYAEAASRLKGIYPNVEFHLVGGLDPSPNRIKESEIDSWAHDSHIIWHGQLADVRPAISSAHVYVLPSYREGTPRSVLEAMAMGRPIITTDAPGCRETVEDGVNGFLVPVCDVESLENAMRKFIESPDMISEMGAQSRKIAEAKYDVRKVNAHMIEAMGL